MERFKNINFSPQPMTINIDVYCKFQPIVSDLVEPLKLESRNISEDYQDHVWTPEDGGNGILISLRNRPRLASAVCDQKSIDEHIALARFAGIDIPEEVIQKFIRDSQEKPRGIHYLVAPAAEGSIQNPLIANASSLTEDIYTIVADSELYDFATKYPHLADVDQDFRLPFGLVKFTQGVPTYEVGLEVKNTATKDTLQKMIDLAGYFAKAFDGIIFNTDYNRFETPDAEKIHENSMGLFLDVAKDVNAHGGKVRPIEF
jgi:hypothetical protein